MTDKEKKEIVEEVEKHLEQKYKGCLSREDTQAVLKETREKWFHNPSKGFEHLDTPMFKAFGNIIYWQVWELIRKLTCIICGRQYVRHLSGCDYADEVADRLCQLIHELKIEYDERMQQNDRQRKAD